ncbi:type II secretion system GspH family protein [bacterium]|jgi:type II secretory pathway pseudopilin PulG|nr:type II secretion system GspH family protein [bacterium]
MRKKLNLRRDRKQNSLTGFTLMELLIVLGVIAILSGILLPTLQKARERGYRSLCQSNLKQLGEAIYIYTIDNNRLFPFATSFGWEPVGTWNPNPWQRWLQDRLVPYVGGDPASSIDPDVWLCKARDSSLESWCGKNSYRYNYWFACGGGSTLADTGQGRRIENVRRPPEAVLMYDISFGDWDNPGQPRLAHNGINVLYADGHVSFVPERTYFQQELDSDDLPYNSTFRKNGWL